MCVSRPFNPDLPRAYGDCRCMCHTTEGVHHVMPCCYPKDDDVPYLFLDLQRDASSGVKGKVRT